MRLLRSVDMRLTSIKRQGGWANDLDHGVVGGLVEQLSAGVVLPPIKVRHDGWLVAGRHRLAAHDALKRLNIRADVIEYATPEEAEADGLCENLRRRSLTAEERDRMLSRLVEIHHSMGVTQPDRQVDGRAESDAPAPKVTKQAAIEKTAKAAQVSPRTVERAVARNRAASQPATKSTPPTEAELTEAIESDHRKRRAKALKRMAELLRKVEACLPDPLPRAWMRIVETLDETKQAVWDASVADAKDPDTCSDEDVPDEDSEEEATDRGLTVAPPPRAPKKLKIQIQDDDGGDIPF